jgi:hypothetical protein
MSRLALAAVLSALFCSAGYLVYQLIGAHERAQMVRDELPPALHVVGVYQGTSKVQELRKTAQDACFDVATTQMIVRKTPDDIDVSALMKCHRITNTRDEGVVRVEVTDSSRPIVLALMAYEPTLWKISLASDVSVRRVIIGGYYGQRTEGLDAETPVDLYTYEGSEPCPQCTQHPKHFYSYEGVPPALQQVADMTATSFQGSNRAERFLISDLTRLAAN